MVRASALLFLTALPACLLDSSGDDDSRPATGVEDRAATCPPPDLFDSALCVCEDLNDVGQLSVVAGPAGIGAVGVNGFTRFVNQTRAAGAWTAYGGFEAVSDTSIDGTLATAGDASWVGLLGVGGDLAVGGDARGVGYLEVGGALRVAGSESLLGPSDVAERAAYQPLAGPPCPCDPATFFDVAEAVAAARTANDNQAAGLPTRLASIGATDLRLEAGSYYFEDARTVGQTRFVIAGRVALFVDGSLDAVGVERFSLEDGAELDLFVAGGIRTVGLLDAGSAADPSAFRLYLGGEDSVLLSVGLQRFQGAIYAPEAAIAYVGDTQVAGSLFARELDGVGRLEIGYGGPGEVEPPSCDPPDDGGDDPGDGGGDPGDGGDDPGDGGDDPGDGGDDPGDGGDGDDGVD